MRKTATALAALLMICAAASAQNAPKKWTLDECIDYAMTHNGDIVLKGADVGIAETRLHSSKMSRVPDLNANLSESVSIGNYNSTTGSMNGAPASVSRDLSYTAGSVSMSVPIFEGLKINNRIKADTYGLEASLRDLEQARKDIGIQVAVKYLQCLYCKSMVKVASEQIALSEAVLEKSRILYEEGSKPKSEQVEAEARLARDNYSLVEAKGKTATSLIELAHLLKLEDPDGFDICDDAPEAVPALYRSEDLEFTISNFPGVLAEQSRILMRESQVKSERSALYPSLSFQGALRTFNVTFFDYDIGWGGFQDQFFKNNMNYFLGLNLSIPIYNRSQTKDRIKLAEYDLKKQQQALDDSRYRLRQEIQTARTDMETAFEKVTASKKNAEASQLAFDYAVERYDSGNCSMTDMLQAEQNLMEAKQREVEAQYEYLIREKIYRFYIDE